MAAAGVVYNSTPVLTVATLTSAAVLLVPHDIVRVLTTAYASVVSRADAFAIAAEPIAEAVTLDFGSLAAAFDDAAGAAGLPPRTLRWLVTVLLGFPLAIAFAALPPGRARHAFSAISGILLAQFVFGSGWVHAPISAGVAYVLMALTGPSKSMPVLVLAWMMAYLSAMHLYRMHYDYMGWSLDPTGTQMLLTIKVTTLAWNYFDGATAAAAGRRTADAPPPPGSSAARIASERAKRAIPELPSLLEYCGYVFCFTTAFAGPAFEISEYRRGVSAAAVHGWGLRSGDGRRRAAASKLAIALCFLALNGAGTAWAPFPSIFSAEFAARPRAGGRLGTLLSRAVWALTCEFFVRTKFYFAWLASEGSANVAGFGRREASVGTATATVADAWDTIRNIEIFKFETAASPTEASRVWNMNTQSWLGRYASQRLPRKWSKIGTYTLSAVWQ